MNVNFEFVESRKGSSLILFEGYLFKKENVYGSGTVAYVCRGLRGLRAGIAPPKQ